MARMRREVRSLAISRRGSRPGTGEPAAREAPPPGRTWNGPASFRARRKKAFSPRTLSADLAQKLKEWTGTRWVVTVARDTEVAKPIEIAVTGPGEGAVAYGHLQIRVEELARAIVVVDLRGSGTYADNLEIIVGDSAALGVIWLAVGVGAFNLIRRRVYDAVGGYQALRFEARRKDEQRRRPEIRTKLGRIRDLPSEDAVAGDAELARAAFEVRATSAGAHD